MDMQQKGSPNRLPFSYKKVSSGTENLIQTPISLSKTDVQGLM
jgi:hypothetical protein